MGGFNDKLLSHVLLCAHLSGVPTFGFLGLISDGLNVGRLWEAVSSFIQLHTGEGRG